jgi:hypothetical protein
LFDVEEEQFTFMKEYLSVQEIEAANEERDTHTPEWWLCRRVFIHNYSGSIHFINLIIFLVVTDWVEIYRRGSLNASTIQELMMFMCTSKFDVEEEQFTFMTGCRN